MPEVLRRRRYWRGPGGRPSGDFRQSSNTTRIGPSRWESEF
jgi:hypothetical protein